MNQQFVDLIDELQRGYDREQGKLDEFARNMRISPLYAFQWADVSELAAARCHILGWLLIGLRQAADERRDYTATIQRFVATMRDEMIAQATVNPECESHARTCRNLGREYAALARRLQETITGSQA